MSTTLQQLISVLVVEDDAADFGLLKAYLKQSRSGPGGIKEPLLWAKTLNEGIDTARNDTPDVVLLDLSLPDSAGLATIRTMRAAAHDIPIVVLTGHDDNSFAAAALEAGAQDYLVKGHFEHDALGRTIRHAIVRGKLEHRLAQSQQRTELALTGGDLGLWDWYVPSGAMTVNERWASMLGYRVTDIETHISAWSKLVHPDDWSVMQTALEAHLQGETPTYEFEHRMRHRDNRWIWVLDRGKVVERDADGQALWVVGTYMDISERKQREAEVHAALSEKETLLKEVYHRVKNNLQVVTSLFNLQLRSLPEGPVRSSFKEGANRVRAMSLVHEKLYQSANLSSIELGSYISDLCAQLGMAAAADTRNIAFVSRMDRIEVGLELAVPLGLLLNELISNSLKHAFPDGRAGEICVTLRCINDQQATLEVCDNGVGLTATQTPEHSASLGLRLVQTLCRQLDAELVMEDRNGAYTCIKFALAEPTHAKH